VGLRRFNAGRAVRVLAPEAETTLERRHWAAARAPIQARWRCKGHKSADKPFADMFVVVSGPAMESFSARAKPEFNS